MSASGRVDLRERDAALTELMDDPACDPGRLSATYRRFGVVNRAVSGWGTIYRRHLRPHLRALDRPARVLDLGSGGGDLVVRLARLARRDGLDVSWVGADPDPRALRAARGRAGEGVEFRAADAEELRRTGEEFDVVISNHVLHHLPAGELDRFARDSLALSRGPVLHGDIERSRLAYGCYAVAVLPFAAGTFLHTDGLRSIRRSYRAHELGTALGHGWHVGRAVPFRLLARGDGRA